MTNLEKIVKHQLDSVFLDSWAWWLCIAKLRKYGKCSSQRVDFDILSLDGSYIFSIFVRGNLFGLKFTAYYKDQDPYVHFGGDWGERNLQGPQISPDRKKFIKDNLKQVLLQES